MRKYLTAYSPMFDTKIEVDHQHADSNDQLILTCHSVGHSAYNLKNHLFRLTELTNLTYSDEDAQKI